MDYRDNLRKAGHEYDAAMDDLLRNLPMHEDIVSTLCIDLLKRVPALERAYSDMTKHSLPEKAEAFEKEAGEIGMKTYVVVSTILGHLERRRTE